MTAWRHATPALGLSLAILVCADTAFAMSLTDTQVWLSQTITGAEHRPPSDTVAWHGRFMVVAWVILIPVGIVIARFYKVTPKQDWPVTLDNQFWWIAHQTLQYGGVLLTGAGLIVLSDHLLKDGFANLVTVRGIHAVCGWAVVILCGFQVLSAWLRGSKGGPSDPHTRPGVQANYGDHYYMTRRRVLFETIHISMGYLLVLLAIVTTLLGLLTSHAPRWMWLVVGTWWILIIWRFLYIQRHRDNVTTYQAIWGPSPEHPGNREAVDASTAGSKSDVIPHS